MCKTCYDDGPDSGELHASMRCTVSLQDMLTVGWAPTSHRSRQKPLAKTQEGHAWTSLHAGDLEGPLSSHDLRTRWSAIGVRFQHEGVPRL